MQHLLNGGLELGHRHAGGLHELLRLLDHLLDELLECGGRHLHLLHVLVEGRGIAEYLVSRQSGLRGDAAEATHEVDKVVFVGGGGLTQHVDSGADFEHLRLNVARRVGQLLGALLVDSRQFADGDHGTLAQHVAQGDVDFVGGADESRHGLLAVDAQLAGLVGQLVELLAAGAGVHLGEGGVELLHLLVTEAGGLHHVGVDIIQFGGSLGEVFHLADAEVNHVEGRIETGHHVGELGHAGRGALPFVAEAIHGAFLLVDDGGDFLYLHRGLDVFLAADHHVLLLRLELLQFGVEAADGALHLPAVDVYRNLA